MPFDDASAFGGANAEVSKIRPTPIPGPAVTPGGPQRNPQTHLATPSGRPRATQLLLPVSRLPAAPPAASMLIYRVIPILPGQGGREPPSLATRNALRRQTKTNCRMREGEWHDMPSRDHPPLRDARAGSALPGLTRLPAHPGGVAGRPMDRPRRPRRWRLLGRGLVAERVTPPTRTRARIMPGYIKTIAIVAVLLGAYLVLLPLASS
jgi:hypothetical protein